MTDFEGFPRVAAFRHHFTGREGFEVAFFREALVGHRVEGHTCAVEESIAWDVGYAIELDASCRTRRATIRHVSLEGLREIVVEADGAGRWKIDDMPAPELDGCFDLDLESSSLTNAFPVRRLALTIGQRADAPAAYVRAATLAVERLEQTYERIADRRYHYRAPRFEYEDDLEYDDHGIVLAYPQIATRQL